MTTRQFPDEWYTKSYSWRMGFISGKWRIPDKPANKLTVQDKTPPEPNPLVLNTEAWRDWNDGYEAGKKFLHEKGEQN